MYIMLNDVHGHMGTGTLIHVTTPIKYAIFNGNGGFCQ